eukprot:CAMPEP_0171102204 /NCGR_PEP_ID=MMETSP0766_2-20121228/57147_1 /TAXON_ID=439317 /ORGANISM="Gambierdiscus australes, Strain CAWD 149" /LENGTH=243 /DNA_ID=CAMNT_0011562439 /DNA_START=46 /DNA_END=773 /DNA_ORIENTATION=+
MATPRSPLALACLCLWPLAAWSLTVKSADKCQCLEWADVYSKHKVVCGMGMELAHSFGNYLPELNLMLRHADERVKQLKSKGRVYKQFCDSFFLKFHANYCVNERYMMQQDDIGKPASGSWCYVSASCRREGLEVEQLPGRDVAVKRCREGEDQSLMNLPIAEAVKLAWDQRLDLGIVSEHAYVYKPMLVKNLTPEIMSEVAATGNATLIWSIRDWFGDRLVVKGQQIWVHKMDQTSRIWGAG